MPRPTAPAPYLLILVDLVTAQGHGLAAVLAGTSLGDRDLGEIGARVSESDFQQVLANGIALTGDPALPLRLGARLNLGAHAVLGQAFMTCRDLRQVIELFLDYYHLLAPGLTVQYTEGEPDCRLALFPPEYADLRGAVEMSAAAILNTLRGLLGRSDLALSFEFPYPEPNHVQVYRELLGPRLRFNCGEPAVLLPRELLDAPLPASNPALRTLYERECARLLADLEQTGSIADRTRALLGKLEGQYPTLPQIAYLLNLSPRTFRRRLADEDTTYQQLLDQVRAEHATRHLKHSQLPLNTIAFMLGFSDASNFRRAYRRWTGLSPLEVRRGH